MLGCQTTRVASLPSEGRASGGIGTWLHADCSAAEEKELASCTVTVG